MDLFIDIIAGIIALPSMAWIYVMVEVVMDENAIKFLFPNFDGKKPKHILLRILYMFVNVVAAAALPFSVALCGGDGDVLYVGIALITFVAAVLAPTVVQWIRGVLRKRRQKSKAVEQATELKKETDRVMQKTVHVIIDRPLGSVHPEHDDIVYEVNYGYAEGFIGGDGEAQDVYVLGVDEPIKEFDGRVVAVIHRKNDVEDKWVVAPDGVVLTDDEIIRKTEFMEKYFEIEILR